MRPVIDGRPEGASRSPDPPPRLRFGRTRTRATGGSQPEGPRSGRRGEVPAPRAPKPLKGRGRQSVWTGMRRLRADSSLGRWTWTTPRVSSAEMRSASTPRPTWNERR